MLYRILAIIFLASAGTSLFATAEDKLREAVENKDYEEIRTWMKFAEPHAIAQQAINSYQQGNYFAFFELLWSKQLNPYYMIDEVNGLRVMHILAALGAPPAHSTGVTPCTAANQTPDDVYRHVREAKLQDMSMAVLGRFGLVCLHPVLMAFAEWMEAPSERVGEHANSIDERHNSTGWEADESGSMGEDDRERENKKRQRLFIPAIAFGSFA